MYEYIDIVCRQPHKRFWEYLLFTGQTRDSLCDSQHLVDRYSVAHMTLSLIQYFTIHYIFKIDPIISAIIAYMLGFFFEFYENSIKPIMHYCVVLLMVIGHDIKINDIQVDHEQLIDIWKYKHCVLLKKSYDNKYKIAIKNFENETINGKVYNEKYYIKCYDINDKDNKESLNKKIYINMKHDTTDGDEEFMKEEQIKSLLMSKLLSYSGDSLLNSFGDIVFNTIGILIGYYINNMYINIMFIIGLVLLCMYLITNVVSDTFNYFILSIKSIL